MMNETKKKRADHRRMHNRKKGKKTQNFAEKTVERREEEQSGRKKTSPQRGKQFIGPGNQVHGIGGVNLRKRGIV